MKWVTREKAKVDRIACPWLIKKFVDKNPEFLFVPPETIPRVVKDTGGVCPLRVESGCGAVALGRAYLFPTSLLRPGLERLRDLVAEGQIQAVLIHGPDRLSRKYAYQVLLRWS